LIIPKNSYKAYTYTVKYYNFEGVYALMQYPHRQSFYGQGQYGTPGFPGGYGPGYGQSYGYPGFGGGYGQWQNSGYPGYGGPNYGGYAGYGTPFGGAGFGPGGGLSPLGAGLLGLGAGYLGAELLDNGSKRGYFY
jgi:hypothetical protein